MRPFAIRDYRHLFGAQVIALFGTGLATVALGLLAYELAGPSAGAVLGTALTIKMVMYVVIAPLAAAYADRLPRRMFLTLLDVVRAVVVLALPFVSEIWHIYVLIGVLQAASAAFTPTFQAVIPDIVTEESDYTRALSASQVAYTMESLLSPVLAAVALTFMTFNWLFVGTSVGFVISAALVLSTRIPNAAPSRRTKVALDASRLGAMPTCSNGVPSACRPAAECPAKNFSALQALIICTPWLTPIANTRNGTRIDIGSIP